MKPFSQACENNKDPILAVLQRHLSGAHFVLEIGSGTGQHAVHFASRFSGVLWQTSDLEANHAGIRQWIEDSGLTNVVPPLALDVMTDPWPVTSVDAVFSANTAHIMSPPMVSAMIRGVARLLADRGLFLLYGPFNYDGAYTSESNARFDEWLRQRDPESAIRDFEDLDRQARQVGLHIVEDNTMPANNRLLVWSRRT